MHRSWLRMGRLLAIFSLVAATAALPAVGASAVADPNTQWEVRGQIDTATGPMKGVRCGSTAIDGSRIQAAIEGVTPGRVFVLTADAGSWKTDFDVTFYPSMAACEAGTPALAHRNHAGDEHAVVPASAEVALVTLRGGDGGSAFTYRELKDPLVSIAIDTPRKPTVVAVIEPYSAANAAGNGYNPYHFDFGGEQHPWNVDADPTTSFDAFADPATYLGGYQGATAIDLTLADDADVNHPQLDLYTRDAAKWAAMKASADADTPQLYRFPGTKVVGAITFGSDTSAGTGNLHAGADSHATKSSSVAAGNIHGTCPECVVVFVSYRSGGGMEALEWVGKQRWIDVVTNSYGYAGSILPATGEDVITKKATEEGQTVFWAAGNGEDMAGLTTNPTYTNARTGPDWHVTVGAIDPDNDQTMGVGQPVDITSYGLKYSSAGGSYVGSAGTHSGTSNATPVVAGTFAKIVQSARDLVGDSTPGHQEDGVLARGQSVDCRPATHLCPLRDGVLTRAEAQTLLFANVFPSPFRTGDYPVPETSVNASGVTGPAFEPPDYGLVGSYPPVFPYQTQGHGVVFGRRVAGDSRFVAEQRRFFDALIGAVSASVRPPAEKNWMFVDSKCRQRLWLEWDGGYYRAGDADPAFDPTIDQPAIVTNAACSLLPPKLFSETPFGTLR